MTKKLNIIFMGSPEFAAQSLNKILEDGFQVVGVITVPDRKKGRGQILTQSEVKQCALKWRIPVFQPTNLKDETFCQEIAKLKPDLGVVVAFRMLPEKIWAMPRLGTVNLHASLLPNYRGAAPINWAIINGEKKTGLTTFFLKHAIDTGDIILQEEVIIENEMNAGELHDILMAKGAVLLSKSISLIESGSFSVTEQTKMVSKGENLIRAPKIFKEDCRINWERPGEEVINFIRGLSPYPGAYSIFLTKSGKELIFKVYKAALTDLDSKNNVGKVLKNSSIEFLIGTKDFYIKILIIQVEGKQKMPVEEFLKGFSTQDILIK